MTIQAYPVALENNMIRATDGSTLPKHARAVLVILPEPSDNLETDWQQAFDAFFTTTKEHTPEADLSTVNDAELNALVHAARRSP